MRNVLAIAHKELRGYFATPIGYVIVGFFTFIFGLFYMGNLDYFVRQSMQMSQMGPQNMNLNQQMIRPLLLNMNVVFLFVMPLITMRTYAEEKRSGTMELLLTSPLTDLQIVVGKFLGVFALYCVMCLITLLHFAVLFHYGNPDWRPLASAYLGLLLFGGCYVALGLFISSLTRNQIIAGAATFGVCLVLWVIDWLGPILGSILSPAAENVLRYASMTGHLEDFVKGVIDTQHIVYYLSIIAFGLFLTMRSVDAERWRG